jgi:hypothetical protein
LTELPPGYRTTTCPRCGGPFACGVDADRAAPCFCVAFALGAERLAQLRARYSDCLCATCLTTLASQPEQEA